MGRRRRIALAALGGLALVVAVTALAWVYSSFSYYEVDQRSMEPAIPRWSHIVVKPFTLEGPRDLARGEIVTYYLTRDPGTQYVIRVIALAGDRVSITGRQVILNGTPLAEPYAVHRLEGKAGPPGRKDLAETIVPPGHVFLLGDNREVAADSRYYGTLPETQITGRVVWQY